MPARHRSRQRAVQVMYLWDVRRQPISDAIDAFYSTLTSEEDQPKRAEADQFMEELVRGASRLAGSIDQRITEHSANWRIDRMPAVDRNILRLAIYEMTEAKTPPPIVIDEALELARQFSGDDSVPFINGVLDAFRKQYVP
jgi:N utilization substance protein B